MHRPVIPGLHCSCCFGLDLLLHLCRNTLIIFFFQAGASSSSSRRLRIPSLSSSAAGTTRRRRLQVSLKASYLAGGECHGAWVPFFLPLSACDCTHHILPPSSPLGSRSSGSSIRVNAPHQICTQDALRPR